MEKVKKKWIAVAAIALLVLFFVGNKKYEDYQQRKQFLQITVALQLVSENLNKGNNALARLNTYDKTVQKVINSVK
ncbi:hypothetical protein [Tenacibaculum dicentrarchi]|uniref:hypothetical protein n=1 Tax=Tenacibaculum dicentrarchi TaxID=669041 RepID=UPI000CB6605E|nr:conserved hypothetical protein [Tenacibaculum dicentrarchi]